MLNEERILSPMEWQREVLKRDGGKCVSCGGEENIQVYFLTPRSLGGRTKISNGITLCQKCRMDNAVRPMVEGAEFRRVRYNVPLPAEFLKRLNYVSMAVGRSMADILREVIAEAVFSEKWKEMKSVEMNGSRIERTNFWVSKPVFEKFEKWCRGKGMTISKALYALLEQWLSEIENGVGSIGERGETPKGGEPRGFGW